MISFDRRLFIMYWLINSVSKFVYCRWTIAIIKLFLIGKKTLVNIIECRFPIFSLSNFKSKKCNDSYYLYQNLRTFKISQLLLGRRYKHMFRVSQGMCRPLYRSWTQGMCQVCRWLWDELRAWLYGKLINIRDLKG